MPAALYLTPTIHSEKIKTVNLGTTANKFTSADIGKAVKLTTKDTYGLCAAGDKIEGIVTSSEFSATGATRGGLSVGGIVSSGYFDAVCAAPLAIGDLVVAADQLAVGTPLPGIGSSDWPATPVQKAGAGVVAPFLARIVGFGPAGTGAAGTVLCAEFI